MADETARASRLSLTPEPVGSETNKKGSARRGSSVVTGWGRYQDSFSGAYSDTSVAIRSDDDFASIGYSYEHSDPEVIAGPPQTSLQPGCSRMDLEYPLGSFNADSPGAQTLAALKQEAIQDRQQRSRNPKRRFTQLNVKALVHARRSPRHAK